MAFVSSTIIISRGLVRVAMDRKAVFVITKIPGVRMVVMLVGRFADSTERWFERSQTETPFSRFDGRIEALGSIGFRRRIARQRLSHSRLKQSSGSSFSSSRQTPRLNISGNFRPPPRGGGPARALFVAASASSCRSFGVWAQSLRDECQI